ncbi:MAG: glycosyltransferase family 4 protein [Actinomycetota bacterium]|nr:glycosyltransferase family 4 protein [Actinomycetota bacterium]
MPKIVHITSVHPAFDVRIFHKEAAELARSGYDVTLIAPHDRNQTIGGVKIKALPEPKSRIDRFWNLWRPIRLALAQRADIYHIHDPELVIPTIFLRIISRAKTVYDVHEDVPKDILSKYWIPRWLRRPVAKAVGLMETMGVKAFDGVVAATPAIARRFPHKKTVIVQNMPILGELQPAKSSPYLERPHLITYVGGISIIRCVNEIIQAIDMLPEALNARLAMAGDFCPPGLETETRKSADFKRVDFIGYQSREKVANLLGQSRIGLVLFYPEANHIESQPNKLFEYMSVGLPVIASNFPLWREIVMGTGCGLVVDSLDPKAISRAIRDLLEDPQEALNMGQRGLNAIRTRYNWAIESQKLLDFYADRLAP